MKDKKQYFNLTRQVKNNTITSGCKHIQDFRLRLTLQPHPLRGAFGVRLGTPKSPTGVIGGPREVKSELFSFDAHFCSPR